VNSAAGTVSGARVARQERSGRWRELTAVVRWSLREARRAPLTWGLSLASLCVLEVAIYPSVSDSLAKATAGYPEALKKAFNLRELTTVQAYLDVEMFSLIVPMALAFFAVRSATRMMVRAEENGWLDIVLAAPVSRIRLVAGSFAATMCSLWLVLAVIAVASEITGVVVGAEIPVSSMLAASASVWALSVFFGGVAVLASGVMHRSVPVTATATGALVGMYVIDLVGKISPSIGAVRWASAFRYYGSALQDGLDVAGFAALTLVGLTFAAIGALLFARRDVMSS
jgi:beta-exotoxin I transport system permease protein